MRVNGSDIVSEPAPSERLVDFLRRDLGLTGTKDACGLGECGACTVLIDGRPALACTTLAARVRGEVETIEGVSEEAEQLRAKMADLGGVQCGFCTPGQIVAALSLVRRGGTPSDEHIRHEMSGNICRCTGYQGIIAAVRELLQGSPS